MYSQIWRPAIKNVLRPKEGQTAHPIRGRRGGALSLILNRGHMDDVHNDAALENIDEALA